jgi:hypothetical protein
MQSTRSKMLEKRHDKSSKHKLKMCLVKVISIAIVIAIAIASFKGVITYS